MPTVVVARYNEPLDWLSAVPDGWRVYVYNKGGAVDVAKQCRWIDTPNVGREAETFCRHNVTVEPADYTVYLQGDPFDHCPDPIGQAKFVMARGARVGWLGPHYDTAWNVSPHTLEDLDASCVWRSLFGDEPMPRRFAFPAGGQMVVQRSNVSARPREWWRSAHGVSTSADWRVSHCFERFWPVIYA